ncbi:hypothetical protein [Chitinivorax sp. B]|uniref:hypothetical protein n=1 Tax=Chitinivorax sp. B TaxID=2502235 RepID=UPI0010F7153E|nr:hypothetical protein [Chitinivorax sp. B]
MCDEPIIYPGRERIATDYFWIILTALSLSGTDLMERLPGRIPSLNSPYLNDGRYNPLIRLISVASTSYGSWYDEFIGCENIIEEFANIVSKPDIEKSDCLKYSREALFDSEWWEQIRHLSANILECSGAGPRPSLPAKIDPSEFDEFPPHCYDCDYGGGDS